MIRVRSFQIYLFFLISLIFLSCRNSKGIDVSNIDLDIKIERFDQDFKKLDSGKLTSQTNELTKKYVYFFEDYIQGMLSLGNVKDTSYFKNLRTVLATKDFKELQKQVDHVFSDLTPTEAKLTDAFRKLNYYFPKVKAPRVISFISGFTVQTPIGENYVGIGLDMFLGADSKFYPGLRASIPAYISRRFTPENITPRITEAFIREDLFEDSNKNKSLLDKMIYNGKVMYLMDQVLDTEPDSVKIGYTDKQLNWCKQYEGEIWAYFLNVELLYETDYMKIQKYLTDAPFTPGIGEGIESAPKLAIFTGWQIVKKYMEQNPEVTIQSLMKEQDSRKILGESKYKPK